MTRTRLSTPARLLALAAAVFVPLGGLAVAVGAEITIGTCCFSAPVSVTTDESSGHHVHPSNGDHQEQGDRLMASCRQSITVHGTLTAHARSMPAVPVGAVLPSPNAAAIEPDASLCRATFDRVSRPPDPPLPATVVLRI